MTGAKLWVYGSLKAGALMRLCVGRDGPGCREQRVVCDRTRLDMMNIITGVLGVNKKEQRARKSVFFYGSGDGAGRPLTAALMAQSQAAPLRS